MNAFEKIHIRYTRSDVMFDQYQIKSGDTVNSIAKKFATNPSAIQEINNLNEKDILRKGTDIVVPKSSDTYFLYYTIEKGDSIYKIARRYNINPELLAGLNGLDMEDYIYPGQEILIPKAEYSYYITKEGDTLNIVSKMFQISKERLLNQNPTIYLQEGQILVNKTR